jgi:hypothetical protein
MHFFLESSSIYGNLSLSLINDLQGLIQCPECWIMMLEWNENGN